MSADLSQTLDMHRRIRDELDQREAAARDKEVEARRAFDDALKSIEGETLVIRQHRELLARVEFLYRDFIGSEQAAVTAVPPTEQPVEPADAEQGTAPDTPMAEDVAPTALEALVAVPTPPADVDAEPEVSSRIESLRSEMGSDLERTGRSGTWWAGMWRSGSRTPEQEASWKKALPPIEGAERAIWEHSGTDRTND